MSNILSVGCDPHLMGVRSMLLEKCGHSVTEAYFSAAALRILRNKPVDLLLICHTFSSADRIGLIAMVRKERKLLPVICLRAREVDAFGDCISVENSPRMLLEAIEQAVPPGCEFLRLPPSA